MSNNKTNVVFDERAPEPQDSSKTLMGCLLLALVPVLCGSSSGGPSRVSTRFGARVPALRRTPGT